jgi:RND family efflux transporter MFP subunit
MTSVITGKSVLRQRTSTLEAVALKDLNSYFLTLFFDFMRAFFHRHLWRILALCIACAGGAAYFFGLRGNEEASATTDRQADVNYENLSEIVFPIEVDTVRRGTFTAYITANGAARAAQSVEVVARMSGFLETAPPSNGAAVAKGQTLARFDNREATLAFKDAEDKRIQAQVEFGLSFREPNDTSSPARARREQIAGATARIQTQLDELDRARAQRAISEKEYAERKTALEAELLYSGGQRAAVMQSKSGLSAALTAVEKAKLQLEYCVVKAPFAGVVANSSLAAGQYIQAGQTLCKILDVSSLLLDVGVLETELPFIRVGTKAEARFQALEGATVGGEVIAVNPLPDPVSKTYTATIRLRNARERRVAPGMFASVRLAAEDLPNRVLLPKTALLSRDKRSVVFVIAEENGANVAQWNYVQTGRANDRFVEILSGVEPGAVVATEGHFTLAHGSPVKITQKAQAKR